jgi:O-antigen/teichoic acid export membrane protein
MNRAILTSAAFVGLSRLAGMGLSMLTTVLVGRAFGPTGLGAFGFFVVTLTILAVPVSQGWATLLLRRVSSALHDGIWAEPKGMMMVGSLIALFYSVLVFCLGFALGDWIEVYAPAFPASGLIAFLALVLFFDQLSALRLAMLRGLDHPVLGQLPEMVVRPAITIIFFLILSFQLKDGLELKHAIWSLLLGSLIGSAIGTGILWLKRPKRFSDSAFSFQTRRWVTDAMTLACYSGLVVLNAYIDIFMLGILGTLEDVGVYRVAAQISLFSGFVFTAVNMLAAQKFSYLLKAGDWKTLKSNAVFMARLAFLGTIPIPVFMFFFGDYIISILFGPAFLPSLMPLAILLFVPMVIAAFGMAPAMLVMNGNETTITRITLATVVLNIILCSLLIPFLGTMGAALATLTSSIFWSFRAWRQARKSVGLDTSIFGMFQGDLRAGKSGGSMEAAQAPDL